MDQTRRRLLRAAVIAPLSAALPRLGASAGISERSLSFHHTHTGENLSIVYHDELDYIPDALLSIDQYLRDFRTGESHSIDTRLLDQLYALRQLTGNSGVFEVISGYRSPGTNASLRRHSKGVAKKSLHMQGRAIDARLAGVDLGTLRKSALSLRAGGVGYYKKSGFLHLDTGRFRTW